MSIDSRWRDLGETGPTRKRIRTAVGSILGTFVTFVILSSPGEAMAQSDAIQLESSTFTDGASIPERNSAYGDNVSPDLSWSGVPDAARSLALVVRDPDAPMPEPFIHWVVYGIPAGADGLPEGLPTDPTIGSPDDIAGTIQGPTGVGRPGYFGPRPPAGSGAHRYIFTLYALDSGPDELDLREGLDEEGLMDAIDGHVLAEGQLVGRFEREE